MVTGLKITLQKKNSLKLKKEIDKSLSIQVSLNGLSFCIYNKKKNKVQTLYTSFQVFD